jgi:hypothetical protein
MTGEIVPGPTAAAPQRRGCIGGIFRWGALGCLGMLVAIGLVVVIIVVIAAVAVGGGGGSHKDVHAYYREGSSGTVTTAGDVTEKVTISKITDPAVSTNSFEQPSPGMHYMTVSVTIENVGKAESHGGTFTLRDKGGYEYDQTFLSGVGASDLNTYQTLTSGGRTDAEIAFEVRNGSAVDRLKFDPNPFATGDLYFDNQ